MKITASLLVVFGLVVALAPDIRADTLYERLGKQPALTAVVDEFYARMLKDPKVSNRFLAMSLPHQKEKLVAFLAQATGGPQKYEGRGMRAAHAHLKITGEEWKATVGHLVGALGKFKVPQQEQRELLSIVGSLEKEIVYQGK